MAKIQDTLNAIRNVVIVGDTEFVIRKINNHCARFFGWSRHDLLGKNIRFLFPEHHSDVLPTTAVLLEGRVKHLRNETTSNDIITSSPLAMTEYGNNMGGGHLRANNESSGAADDDGGSSVVNTNNNNNNNLQDDT